MSHAILNLEFSPNLRSIKLDKCDTLLDSLGECFSHELNNGCAFALLLWLDFFNFSWLLAGRSSLNVSLQIFESSWTAVFVDFLAILDPEQCWIAFDVKVLADGSILGAVELGNVDSWVVFNG